MGWSGFNGGAPYAANVDASLAIINTHLCTATSLLVWTCLDILYFSKPSVIGAVQGMITGLVCITPAAGLVQGWAAILMGILSGSIPWFTMMVLHKKIKVFKHVDDTLAVFHTHGIAGTLGGILTGLMADPNLARLFFGDNPMYVGLFYGFHSGRSSAGFRQIGMQFAGIIFIVVLNVVITSVICLLIRLVVPLRLSDEVMQVMQFTGRMRMRCGAMGKCTKNPFMGSRTSLQRRSLVRWCDGCKARSSHLYTLSIRM